MRSQNNDWPWRRRRGRLLGAFFFLFAGTALQVDLADRVWAEDKPLAAAADADYEESWQAIYIGKTRVGYGRSSVGHKAVDGQDRVVTETEMTMAISRFGQSVKTKTVMETEETPAGDLIEFRFELLNPPAAPVRSSGRVREATLVLTTETNGKTTTKDLPWDESIKSPTYHERQLREDPIKAGQKRSLKTFDPQFAKVNTITLQAGEFKNVALLGGKAQKLLEVTVRQSVAPQIVAQDYLDAKGDALKTTVSLLGMATYKVSRAEALKELTGDEVDLAVATLVKTGEVKQARQTTRVVYRITTAGEDPEASIPAGPTQKIVRVSPNTVDLTVEAILPSDDEPAGALPGKEFTAANTYIQSDDELVRKHAEEATAGESDPWKAAQLMEQWVQRNLKKKNFSTLLASAAEVAKDLSGDCTEHAVLLAAMCRARGIPARVAVGLVYVPEPSSFGGHMWTEVFVRGKWIPLDATLGKGGIAADHIKFADSSFSDDGDSAPLTAFLPMVSVLSKLKIEVREVKHDK
jgi:transglutaminase-like putative cysteine protease